jgi:hypothetical protein
MRYPALLDLGVGHYRLDCAVAHERFLALAFFLGQRFLAERVAGGQDHDEDQRGTGDGF